MSLFLRDKSHKLFLVSNCFITVPSWPLWTVSVQLHPAETNEIFSLPQCQSDLTLKKLKSHLELLTRISLHFHWLQYIHKDLPDEFTSKDSDIVPGETITTCIWQQDGWGHLAAAAAKGETTNVVNGWDEKTTVQCGRCSPTWKWFLRKNSSMRQLKIVPERPLSNTSELPTRESEDSMGTVPYAELLGAVQKKERVAH
ncbi:ankyrin repeat domain-containing protein 60 [Chlamydotis macqueenii]